MKTILALGVLLLSTAAGAQTPTPVETGPWKSQQTLVPSLIDTTYGTRPIRVSGDTAFVSGSAVVYVYARTGSQWAEQQILFVGSDGSFGRSLDFDGTSLIVGGAEGSYLYKRVGGGWQ